MPHIYAIEFTKANYQVMCMRTPLTFKNCFQMHCKTISIFFFLFCFHFHIFYDVLNSLVLNFTRIVKFFKNILHISLQTKVTFSHEIRIHVFNIFKITVHKRLIAVCLLVLITDRSLLERLYITAAY